MPIRHLVLALPFVACLAPEPALDARVPALGERQDDIICTPVCSPGYTELLNDTYSYGFRLFPDAGYIYYEGCGNPYGAWMCTVTMQTGSDGSCSRIDCAQQPGARSPRCSWSPSDCQ